MNQSNGLSLQEYFKYHPPATQARIDAHNKINEFALAFATVVEEVVVDPDCKKMAFFAIQQARMFANQGATVDELILQRAESSIEVQGLEP